MQQAVSSSAVAAPSRGRPMPMVAKLAYRNLFHDRLSLVVTLVGIVFSVVLVAVQFGLYIGSEVPHRRHAGPDARRPVGDPLRHQELRRSDLPRGPGEASRAVDAGRCQRRGAGRRVRRLAHGLHGGTTAALLVGSDTTTNTSAALGHRRRAASAVSAAPSAVAVDRTYFEELGIKGIGDRAEINGTAVTVNDRHATASAPSPRCPTSSPPWPWRARCSAPRPTSPPTRS